MTEWIITSSVLILIIIALRGLLKQKLRPTVMYALWSLVLVRLLLPFSLYESAISIENVTQGAKQEVSAAVTRYESNYEQILQQHAQAGIAVTPSQAREEVQQQMYSDAYASISNRYSQQGITVPEQQLRQEALVQAQAVDFLALAAGVLPGIWYIGMALMTLVFLVSNGWFAWNLLRTRTLVTCNGSSLPVYETAYTATPCLFGLIRPGVYLTPEAAQDPVMCRHVLAHELTHYRHGDHVWSMLRGVCLILHWYNPLVWAAAILSRKDAELACDEATIRVLGEDQRTAYGRTLISMTCIRHDPKSFLVTATTMVSGKNTLKDRVTAIARKPRNAFVAIVACVLVLAIAAGCTFTGAPTEPTEPTEPTSPDDTVYEKLEAAAQAINSRNDYHFKQYITNISPSETDPTQYDYIEGWVSGDDMYTEQIHLGTVTPRFLCYEGSSYSHMGDNLWFPITGTSNNSDTYRVDIPSRDNTMTWTETDDYLDVCFTESENPSYGTEIRLDSTGRIVWYALYIPAQTVGEDGQSQPVRMYSVLIYQDTDPAQIRSYLDTVAPDLIANMELYDFNDSTTPDVLTQPFPFIYRDDPSWDYWREYIGPNDCMDGYLYVQDRATMEIILVLDTPVECFTETQDHLFCVMQDGRILQVDYTGANQQTLYQASGVVSDIFYLNSKLYFNDGTELTVLDLDTLSASVVGSFTDYQTIYAVTDTWLWLNAQGKDYAYDTVTGELVLLYTGQALDRFLAGHWPEAPDTGVDLPDNYTLDDIVTSYEETLTWTELGNGHEHEASFSIPVIYPFSTDAVSVQEQIDTQWLFWLEEQRTCRDLQTGPAWMYIRYDAVLNGDLLSIVIDVWWISGTHGYQVYNLDLTTGEHLTTAEMANRFLHISYPEFLMAVSEYRMDELQETRPNIDAREYMARFAPDIAEMDQATLYLDKDGNLCLRYDSLDIAGAMFYPTVKNFSLKDVDWDTPTEQTAYLWLFNLYNPEAWREHILSDYWSLLQNAYVANPAHFESAHSQLDDAELQTQIWDLVTHDDPTKTK